MGTPAATSSYAENPQVKNRKRKMSSDSIDEIMAKGIDKMEQTWTEHSRLSIHFDMATEAVMLLMNHLASDEGLGDEVLCFSFGTCD